MLVYGDPARTAEARLGLERIRERLRTLPPDGTARHSALVTALIEAGELAQGVADLELDRRGADAPSPLQDALMRLLLELAGAIRASWRGEPVAIPDPRIDGLPAQIRAKCAEGFAFYALYPELYLEAARALRGRDTRVVGIRSIGTALAAMVAAETGAPLPRTVRPGGHPFKRELKLDPTLARELAEPRAELCVVDEGPGLSGSSFGAVADFLESRGVPRARIHFFPSHRGELGPQASAPHRERWSQVQRHVADFESVILPRLAEWTAPLVGEALEPPADLSGGAWRARRFADSKQWAPSNVQQERRKYLLSTSSGRWLLRFAGLGPRGEAALARARELRGFIPEVAGLVHGFLVERWVEARQPEHVPLERVAGYLGRRARLDADPEQGASVAKLLEMARYNAGGALDGWSPDVGRLERRVHRVATDNRLHAWEWLQLPEGTILKADAHDHCAAHDLVGCQDLAWDVAGASIELGLDAEALRHAVERECGRSVDPALVDFCLRAYPAFQLGHHALSAQALAFMPDEAARLQRASERYAALL